MGIPFFQQQSAAYNTHQKHNLHIFTPDGRRYSVDASGKSYAEYAEEVQEYLVPFEVEALRAQRDSLRDALMRRYLLQHFGVGGDAHFAGMDLDNVTAELKLRGITPGAIKSALRSTVTRVTSEIKNSWPIRENGHNLQYTSYDIIFAAEETKTTAKRQKIWDAVAAWASSSSLPGKEGARLATVQDWDDRGDGHAISVDLHHYPRSDLDSCRAITLLEAAERNRDLDVLRQALARIGVKLDKPYMAKHGTPPRATAPVIESAPALASVPAQAPAPAPAPALEPAPAPAPAMTPLISPLPAPIPPEPTLAETLAAVRFERDRLDQQLRLLSDALTDHDERQRQAQRIESLEALLSGVADLLDNIAWPNKPPDWTSFTPVEKWRHVVKAFEDTLTAHRQSEKSLQIAKSEVHMLATELRETRKSRDQWKSRAESVEAAVREELQKKHETALLAQEIDFTRQIESTQQEHMREVQHLRDEHLRQLEKLQDIHLTQIQKLRRLTPAQDTPHVEAKIEELPPSAIPSGRVHMASELSRYQAESQEIFDSRIGEYLRIAKDQGLRHADEWLLTEAKKLAEARAKQGVLGI